MRIEELNPEKFYAVIVENEHASIDDLEQVKQRLVESGANAVVLTDNTRAVSLVQPERYWGIYFPELKRWLVRTNTDVVFYPAACVATAHLENYLREAGVNEEDIKSQNKMIVKEMSTLTTTDERK